MCVNTIVLTRPMRRASAGAASCDTALSRPVQKKKTPAPVNDMPKRSNSHSASSALMISPPAKESTLKRPASFRTMPRDGPSEAGGVRCSVRGG